MLAQATQLYEEDKFSEALDVAEKIYNLDATWLDNLLILASAHTQLRNHSESIFYNQQAIRVDPTFAEGYSNLGNTLKELGDINGAVHAYLKAIKLKPRFADAYNNLACAYAQLGRIDQAIETYRMALVVDPSLVEAHSNLGNMLKVKGNYQDAKKAYLEAIRIRPSHAISWSNLGGIFKEERDLKTAIEYYREAIRLMPQFADAYSNLGGVLKESGMIGEAKEAFKEAIRLRPDFAVAHGNLGNCYFDEGAVDTAIRSYKHAIQLEPNFPDAYNNLGNALRNKGDLDQAVACYRTALRLKADHPHAYNNLGNTLKDKGLVKEAMHCYATACRLMSNFPEAQNNLGALLKEQGKQRIAIAHFEEAIASDPNFAEALCNMGCCYKDLFEMEKAIQCFTSAIEKRPNFSDAYFCLGGCFHEVGRLVEAVKCYEKALELRPAFTSAFVRLLDAKSSIVDWTDRETELKRFREIIVQELHRDCHRLPCVEPFKAMTIPGFHPEQLRQLAEKHAKFGVRSSVAIVEGYRFRFRAKKPLSRLRIGYVSSDFGNHPVGRSMLGTISEHDRSSVEIFCYALRPDDMSHWRREFESNAEHFIDVSSESCFEIARRIHKDDIHVLVNLNGYTKGARNEIFALRPAPVQCQYLGFFGTMGANFVDYILADDVTCPTEHESHFTEKIVQLPSPFLVTDHKESFSSCREEGDAKFEDGDAFKESDNDSKKNQKERPTRVDVGLPEDKFVICCFAQHAKIDPAVFSCWCRVLKACPNTTLWLLAWTEQGRENLFKAAETHHVSRDRIVFSDVLPRKDHMQRCYLADLYVDTITCNSTNTLCDALWNGVPAVTVLGSTMSSRTSATVLRSMGLEKNVLSSIAEYEEKIVECAGNIEATWKMRDGIRARRNTLGLFDATAAARKLEKAYKLMWRKHEWGEEPSHIAFDAPSKSGATKAGD